MIFNTFTFLALATTFVNAAPQIRRNEIDLRNKEGAAIIVINDDNFRGDDRRFGRWGGRDHGRFDDRFLEHLANDRNRNDRNRNDRDRNDRDRNDLNLNIVELLLGNDINNNRDRNRVGNNNRFDVGRFGQFNNFNRFDDRLNEILIIRLDEVNRARERDNDRRRRERDFVNRRRRDFLQRRDNIDVVVVIATPVQNRRGGILERPFLDYQYHLFHNIGATETQTQVFTDAITLTVEQTIGPNGEQATALPTTIVDSIATPTSVEATPTGVVEEAPVETGVEEIVEELPAQEVPVEELPVEAGPVEEASLEEVAVEETPAV